MKKALLIASLLFPTACAEILVSTAQSPDVVVTTAYDVPTDYEVLGTIHAQTVILRFFFAIPAGPAMQEVDRLMAERAKALGANAVIGVQYNQSWWSYQASGTAVRFKPPHPAAK